MFASGPDGRAFGAHINLISVSSSLHAIKVLGKGGTILENMSRGMKRAFRKADLSHVTISLVGGHKKMDLDQVLQRYSPEEEAMWTFSGVVRRCVAEALPGATVDASLLNRFEGIADLQEEIEEHECSAHQADCAPPTRLIVKRCSRTTLSSRRAGLSHRQSRDADQVHGPARARQGWASAGVSASQLKEAYPRLEWQG